jgi:integrase
VKPIFGGYPLVNVTRNRVREFLTQIARIRSPKTVELVHAVISGIFSEAIELGYTRENPALALLKKVLPPKKKRRRQMPDPFSREDLESLLDAAEQHLPENICLALKTMAYSGMRLGESLAMNRNHLDIANCQYMVSQTVRNARFGEPKTGKRLMDLPNLLVKDLAAHIRGLRKQAMGGGRDVEYIFEGLTQRGLQEAMKRACLAAKLRARSPHDLRHTYATLLLMAHYSPAYVQKQLKHYSITMTVDIYGHWIPGEGKKDLEKTFHGQKQSEPAAEDEATDPKKIPASVLRFRGKDD